MSFPQPAASKGVTSITGQQPCRVIAFLVVETEDQIFRRFEAELAAVAVLDRRYYTNPSPTIAERADYAARQVRLERVRSRYYSELGSFWEYSLRQFRRCRFLARRTRRRHP